MQEARIQSLVRELIFHRLCGMAPPQKKAKIKKKKNNIKKQESICLNIDKNIQKLCTKSWRLLENDSCIDLPLVK